MARRLRTAILVVHGMGSQRPLETVRGVINAVWFDDDDHTKGGKKLWSHPEPSGVDLDLSVMTTNDFKTKTDERVADFHELYWAHLMSETKSVAVLLWLFELARKGPHLQTVINGLWWCGTVFLCLLLLSASLVSVRAMTWFAGVPDKPYSILAALFLMILVAVGAGYWKVRSLGWQKLPPLLVKAFFLWILVWAAIVLLIWMAVYFADVVHENPFHSFKPITFAEISVLTTNVVLVPSIALFCTYLLMGRWGVRSFCWAYGLSTAFFLIYLAAVAIFGLHDSVGSILREGRVHWSLASPWSVVAACLVIGAYLAVNAAFLQPYLGDAARYFRNSPANVAVRREIRKEAVKTLDQLHRSRDYDRIVVVAHSLGTVVAYDMLRAYYSRICDQIVIDKEIHDPQFEIVNDKDAKSEIVDEKKRNTMRTAGRQLIGKLAAGSNMLADTARQDKYKPAKDEEVDVWLVTDFVTLGSPLTHGHYFMVPGKDANELDRNFADGVRERELPTCPPVKLDADGRIAFIGPNTGLPRLHHGGTFGLTRWTNLFFPMLDIFWGDAIGGPIKPVFGDCVKDVEVSTNKASDASFFAHVDYWKTDCPDKRAAPHLQALIDAIDLADKDMPVPPAATPRA